MPIVIKLERELSSHKFGLIDSLDKKRSVHIIDSATGTLLSDCGNLEKLTELIADHIPLMRNVYPQGRFVAGNTVEKAIGYKFTEVSVLDYNTIITNSKKSAEVRNPMWTIIKKDLNF